MIIDVGRIVLRLSVAKLRWYQLGKQGDLVVLPKRRRRTGNPTTNIRPYWPPSRGIYWYNLSPYNPPHHYFSPSVHILQFWCQRPLMIYYSTTRNITTTADISIVLLWPDNPLRAKSCLSRCREVCKLQRCPSCIPTINSLFLYKLLISVGSPPPGPLREVNNTIERE